MNLSKQERIPANPFDQELDSELVVLGDGSLAKPVEPIGTKKEFERKLAKMSAEELLELLAVMQSTPKDKKP